MFIARQFDVLIFADDLKVDLEYICKAHKSIKEFAYIYHDKDGVKPHYHIYLNFGRSLISAKIIANWFEIPESSIYKVKCRKIDMLRDLIHSSLSLKNKHQYSPEEVVANFDYFKLISII